MKNRERFTDHIVACGAKNEHAENTLLGNLSSFLRYHGEEERSELYARKSCQIS